MKTSWLDDFMKWFFNASPLWVDERKIWRPDEAEYAKAESAGVDRSSHRPERRRPGGSRSTRT